MRLPFIFRLPKVQLIGILLLIFLTALPQYPLITSIRLFIYTVSFTVFFDLLITWTGKKQLFVPFGGLVTGIILSMLITPDASVVYIVATAAIAILSKHYLRISGKQVFNPAGFGLFVSSIIFSQHVTWWGVAFQSVSYLNSIQFLVFLILLLPLLITGYRLRRFPGSATFLVTYAFLSQFLSRGWSWISLLQNLLNPTLIFFAIVMLPEPKTSPGKIKIQFWYGLAIAAIIYLLTLSNLSQFLTSHGLLPDILLLALLISNLCFFKFK